MQVRPRLLQVERHPEQVRTPGHRWNDVRRLAVVRDDRMGDLVLTLPAVHALRTTYPAARLVLMVAPAQLPLARMIEGVDEVLEAERRTEGLRRQFERIGSDLVVCVSRRAGPAWAAFRAGVPHRVGSGRRLYSPLYERRVMESRRGGARHEAEYALSFAHRAGATGGVARFPLAIPDEAMAGIDAWLASRRVPDRFVVLHPGSGGSCPVWPATHYGQLAARLHAEGVPVVLSIGPLDGTVRQELEQTTPAARVLPCFDAGFPLLPGLLRRATLLIGNSTGPLHLAAALGTPTLALHAPWPTCGVRRWGPYAGNGWGLVAEHPQADRWSQRERRRHARALMATISPRTTAGCALDLLEGRTPRLP